MFLLCLCENANDSDNTTNQKRSEHEGTNKAAHGDERQWKNDNKKENENENEKQKREARKIKRTENRYASTSSVLPHFR